MSFQAYLDAVEKKTGTTPQQIVDEPATAALGADTKAGEVVQWLLTSHGIGRGHAAAMSHVIRKGPEIGDRHVGTTGSHRNESSELRLDGLAGR